MKKILLIAYVIAHLTGCGQIGTDRPLLLSVTALPDTVLSEPGKGFTCTGLTYDADENVFWIGNCGKNLPEAEYSRPTIVKVEKDTLSYLDEIDLYSIYPSMIDVQGVTLDTSDDSLWVCSFSENKIRHISKKGNDKGCIDIEKPTGIAYDSRTDTLWVLTYTELINMNKDGDIIETIGICIEGQDQIFLDEKNHLVYLTAGLDYKRENYVYLVDLSTKEVSLKFIPEDSYAIEGIFVEENIMYVLNDGYYHSAKIPINQLNKYDTEKR